MKGLTIVEIMVCVVIFSVLFVGIYGVLNVGNLSYLTDMNMMRLQQAARQSMQQLSLDLRNATNPVVTVIDASSDKITFDTYGGSGISYYRDAADLNGDGITSQIIREYPAGTRKVIANDISLLKFTPVGSLVTINMTASCFMRLRQLSYSLREQIRLRN